jgi:ABC-2 type transport system ATP-binding protein
LIQVENVTKRYGQRLAVDGLNFRVDRGEILGFLGPNGAGKSTTMNIITGYLSATEGTVTLDGHDILEEPQVVKRQIGYLPELPPLYTDMTVQDYLSFACDIKGVARSRKRESLDRAMSLLRIADVRRRLIKNLSKGYRQRVGVAQAIIGTPPVLILDEPTIGLDVMTAISIREFLRRQAREGGRTIILASHNMSEVEAICDRVAIIDRGKIVASGAPDSLKRALGAPALVMEIAPVARDLELLASVEGVKGYTATIDEERGLTAVQAVVQDEAAVERATEAIRGAGYRVLTSWRRPTTLEEVFVSLVGKGFREREEHGGD